MNLRGFIGIRALFWRMRHLLVGPNGTGSWPLCYRTGSGEVEPACGPQPMPCADSGVPPFHISALNPALEMFLDLFERHRWFGLARCEPLEEIRLDRIGPA